MDATLALTWLRATAQVVAENRDHLTHLDAAIGDSDHGVNLDRGFSQVVVALRDDPPATPGAVLKQAGTTLISKVGGASGPLYGTAFRRAGAQLGDAAEVSAEQFQEALRAAVTGVRQLGAANPGDKTMIDAWVPAVDAFAAAVAGGAGFAAAVVAAANAARDGATATIPMQALKGRASYLGARSMGHEDPGAASTALIFAALAEVSGGAPVAGPPAAPGGDGQGGSG